MRSKPISRVLAGLALAFGLTCGMTAGAQTATVLILNANGPGVGFNDPTPAAPVGGNTATTVGDQRLTVFQTAGQIWGKKLKSDVPITILSLFTPLDCDASSAVLGAAGAYNVLSDFPNAVKAGTWYPGALANKLANEDLTPEDGSGDGSDIIAFFNADLGQPGCLEGGGFYLGLDGQPPAGQIDLLTTILHEFGHGLGFQTFTDDATGEYFYELPSIWDHLLLDPKRGKTWVQMDAAERAASAIDPRNLAWNGPTVIKAAPKVLDRGTPDLFIYGRDLNRFLQVGPAQFGPPIDKHTLVSAPIEPVVDTAGTDGTPLGLACTALDLANRNRVHGKIALVDRGSCPFTVKVKNAQDAGAIAVIVADNAPGGPPSELAGSDATITIPSLRITKEDGVALKFAIAQNRGPLLPYGVVFLNQLKLAGADYAGRPWMFTPNPNQPGSSVSHWDTLARPNLLMEPFLSDGQPIAISAPQDLTLELLKDIGW